MEKKSRAAQELGSLGGKARARSHAGKEGEKRLKEIGSKGGTSRWAGMTPEERRKATENMRQARRKK